MPTGIYPHKKHSAETRKKMSLWQMGSKNNVWKGGVSKDKKHKRDYHNNYNRSVKVSAHSILGSKCVKCGFEDSRALQIDHIFGGGTKERKEYKNGITQFYKKVIESVLKKENKYQLLCANCNWIKRDENREILHRSMV